jgi:hypothetical protein
MSLAGRGEPNGRGQRRTVMRNRRIGFISVAALTSMATLLAACGNVVAAEQLKSGTLASTGTSAHDRHAGPPGGVDPHKWAAELDVARLLGGYVPPPASVRLATAPKGSDLGVPPSSEATRDLVDRARLWRTPGDMKSVIAWARAHAPANSSVAGTGESGTSPPGVRPSGSPGPPPAIGHVQTMDITFSLPATGPALASRQVLVSVAADGPGEVVMRVDGQDVWYPTRPTWSYDSSLDTSVTITVWTGAGGSEPHTVTSTKPAAVGQLRRLVGALPMSTGGISGCPAEFGQHFSVVLSGPHAPSVTVSQLIPECGGMRLSEPGHGAVELEDTGGRVLAAAEALSGTTGP